MTPGPCGAVRVRGEHADVGAEFGQNGARRRGPDPGDGLQQPQRLRVLAVLGKFAVEGAFAVRACGCSSRDRTPSRSDRLRVTWDAGSARMSPVGKAVEDAPPVLAEDVGEHAAHPQARAVDQLVRPVAEPRPILGRLPPVPARRPQLPVPLWKDKARTGQPELADPRQPHAVPDIRLAPADLLDALRVQNQRPDARRLERVQRRLPSDPGRLHRRRRLAARKPVRHLPEAPGRGRQAGAGRFGMRPRPGGRMQTGARSRRVRDSFLSGNLVTENKTSTLPASAAHHRRSRRKSPPGARGRPGTRFMVGSGRPKADHAGFWGEEGEAPLIESGANALTAFKCCIKNNRRAEFLDWRVCRAAVCPKNGIHPAIKEAMSSRSSATPG